MRLPVKEDVTTRAYHFYAFPTSIIAANDPSKVEWTLTNFIHLAYDTRPQSPVPLCFYLFDYAINPHLETLRTDSELMHDLLGSRLTDFVARQLADGRYLYLNVDEHDIPNRFSHGRKRFSHDLLVHGYDPDAGTVDVLGYDDTPAFRSVTIPARALDSAFAIHRELDSPCRQFVLYRFLPESTYEFDKAFVAQEIRAYLRSENPTSPLRALREPWEREYGLSAWRCFADEMTASRHAEREYDLRSSRVLYEHSLLMLSRIELMLSDDRDAAADAVREYRPVVRYCRSLGYAALAAESLGDHSSIDRLAAEFDDVVDRHARVLWDLVGDQVPKTA
ncbi:hypothetical protein ABZ816_15570 [Actinosynnema sp. NPDC047251]|uniref:hypothetical protein n=1 Tax=Saccharothrix espanaensis TaxID=103731 RepID=UPI0011DDFBBF|nr:hypothetical protein [Saccharothrix espanaensis]